MLAVYGYLQGFLVGVLSLAGFAAGAFVGTRLGPRLLPQGSSSPYAPLFGLAGALLAGGVLASGLEGIGLHLRRRVTVRALGVLDGLLGAALSACVALGIAWILGAVALQTPGARDLRDDIQRSAILRRLNYAAAALRADPQRARPLRSGPADQRAARRRGAADRRDRARPGGARRRRQRREGARHRLRAGRRGLGLGRRPRRRRDQRPRRRRRGRHDGPGARARLAARRAGDPLRPPQRRGRAAGERASDAPALRIAARVPRGTPGAILGFPENGPYNVSPARVGVTQSAISQDAYGNGPVTRVITSFRGVVREGNSGGPMVDACGRVLTTVFAATVGGAAGRLRRARHGRARCARAGARPRRHRALRTLSGAKHSPAKDSPGRRATLSADEQDARDRREALRRARPRARAARPVRQERGRGLPRGPRARHHRGPSGTSCSSPSPTSTTPSSRSGAWPTCRSCPTASSSSCATSARRSR